jgi:predicted Zn-dependent protease
MSLRRIGWTLALLLVAGCAGEGGVKPPAWTASLLGNKGANATVLSGLKPGAYEPSSLAVGEDKDLAQHRGDALGFVRSAALEQYLNETRRTLLTVSGKTGVPGRVVVLANPGFEAFSSPDGNVYVAMGLLESLESADEVSAILAHELAHVLLTHHSSDLLGDVQRKGQALYELGVGAKTALAGQRTVSKGDSRNLTNVQLATDATDKLVLPAWSRGQEREADLLGVDLLVEAHVAGPAMVTMLEKLQAWEQANKESEDAFSERLKQASQRNVNEAVGVVYQRLVDTVSVNHPKTSERIEDTAQYFEKHYGGRPSLEPQVGPWKAVRSRPEVAQVFANYKRAFSARRLLEEGKTQEAYVAARGAVAGRTATDAYPNWVLAHSAAALGRHGEAIEALRRAIASSEPVPLVYEDLIFAYERAGNIPVALSWTDHATKVFAGAPRFKPHKIRLLRKAGRVPEAQTLTVDCALNGTTDLKRACQEANQTPAGRAAR